MDRERTSSQRSPVQTEIQDGRNKRFDPSLTTRSHKVNDVLHHYPKFRRVPVAAIPMFAPGFAKLVEQTQPFPI